MDQWWYAQVWWLNCTWQKEARRTSDAHLWKSKSRLLPRQERRSWCSNSWGDCWSRFSTLTRLIDSCTQTRYERHGRWRNWGYVKTLWNHSFRSFQRRIMNILNFYKLKYFRSHLFKTLTFLWEILTKNSKKMISKIINSQQE